MDFFKRSDYHSDQALIALQVAIDRYFAEQLLFSSERRHGLFSFHKEHIYCEHRSYKS